MAAELRFTEDEVAGILWALFEAADLAEQMDALSAMALIEEWYGLLRRRFDERGEE